MLQFIFITLVTVYMLQHAWQQHEPITARLLATSLASYAGMLLLLHLPVPITIQVTALGFALSASFIATVVFICCSRPTWQPIWLHILLNKLLPVCVLALNLIMLALVLN